MVRRDPPDVLHLHDWHTGAVLAALPEPPPSVLTLHNIAYQGVTDGTWLRRIGPRGRHYEWWGGTNPLAGASPSPTGSSRCRRTTPARS